MIIYSIRQSCCYLLFYGLLCLTRHSHAAEYSQFDVVVAGGSTAALAAAVSAAEQGSTVALLEPTDWVGGQITASGVPAIDEAWHRLTVDNELTMDVAKIARNPRNMSPLLRDMLLATGCPGRCWVSRFCFEPRTFMSQHLNPLIRQHPRLFVFRETVAKHVQTRGNRIRSLTAIQRFPKPHLQQNGYDVFPSTDIPDWYSAQDSNRFTKQVHHFRGDIVFVDATEWGELLVLSDAPFLQGVEAADGSLDGDDQLGQSITYGFVQELHETPDPRRDQQVPQFDVQHLGYGDYAEKPDAWELIWTYRRLKAKTQAISSGDLSLQNWGYYPERNEGGNDYPFGYLFLSRSAARRQAVENWHGGIDLAQLSAAEQRAIAWHHWFKERAPDFVGRDRIALNTTVLGTGHGLSKLPYIRDTRRSVGIGQFVLRVRDLQPVAKGKLARQFPDRIAIGAYPVDVHPMHDRRYPEYVYQHYDVAPFTIPFRALTNARFENLLVAGKTMAQTFLANSATRLHPTEWSTGIAAGVAAAFMSDKQIGSANALKSIAKIQTAVSAQTPIDWQMD